MPDSCLAEAPGWGQSKPDLMGKEPERLSETVRPDMWDAEGEAVSDERLWSSKDLPPEGGAVDGADWVRSQMPSVRAAATLPTCAPSRAPGPGTCSLKATPLPPSGSQAEEEGRLCLLIKHTCRPSCVKFTKNLASLEAVLSASAPLPHDCHFTVGNHSDFNYSFSSSVNSFPFSHFLNQ